MATKLHTVSELTARAMNKLTPSADEWMGFLHSAAWLYKYPWHEQVMIYAQRADAVACAPIALWNDTFHRWVNKGAKGIAILDDSGAKPTLRYVFDVSDTNSRSGAPFRLWEAKRHQYEQIVAELQNHFGDADLRMGTIQEYIMGVVANAVSDNYKDYAGELVNACDGSGLDDKGTSEIDVILFLHLIPSVTYAALVRMGVDPQPVINADSFPEQIAVPMLLGLPQQQAAVISNMFSIPQLITALIGGAVAIVLFPRLKKAIREKRE